jgi:hypothetical protein
VVSRPSHDPGPIGDADLERLAVTLGLTIDPALRAAVAQQLAGLLAAARLVEEFALPESTEMAPGFEP